MGAIIILKIKYIYRLMKFCELTVALLLINGEASAFNNKLSKQLSKVPFKMVKSPSD